MTQPTGFPAASPGGAPRRAVEVAPWVLFFLGVVALFVSHHFYPPVDFESAWIVVTACALPVWLAIVFPALWRCRSTWRMKSAVLAGLGWLLSMIAFPSGVALVLNGTLDRSDPVVREARVERVHDGRDSDSSDYVYVDDWNNPGASRRIRVLGVSGVVPGSTLLRATCRSGWLGIEWMPHHTFATPGRTRPKSDR